MKSFVKFVIHLFQPMHICEIPHVIFKSTSYFSFKFSITLLCHERKLLCTFVAQTIYTLVTRRRALDFQVFGSKFVKFLMSILKRQVSFSSIFASFFTVMPHNFSVNFKPIHFLLWTKGPHQSSNFDSSTRHFPSNKSVFLQILHHSWMSWKITPAYFFSSDDIYFAEKEPIKVKICETFDSSGHNLSNSLCQFWNGKSISLQILYPSSVSWNITPLYFFCSNNT